MYLCHLDILLSAPCLQNLVCCNALTKPNFITVSASESISLRKSKLDSPEPHESELKLSIGLWSCILCGGWCLIMTKEEYSLIYNYQNEWARCADRSEMLILTWNEESMTVWLSLLNRTFSSCELPFTNSAFVYLLIRFVTWINITPAFAWCKDVNTSYNRESLACSELK